MTRTYEFLRKYDLLLTYENTKHMVINYNLYCRMVEHLLVQGWVLIYIFEIAFVKIHSKTPLPIAKTWGLIIWYDMFTYSNDRQSLLIRIKVHLLWQYFHPLKNSSRAYNPFHQRPHSYLQTKAIDKYPKIKMQILLMKKNDYVFIYSLQQDQQKQWYFCPSIHNMLLGSFYIWWRDRSLDESKGKKKYI